MLGRAIGKNGVILALFALSTAGVLAGTYQLTKTRIAESERQAAQKALLEVVPLERHNNDMLADTLPIAQSDWPQLGLTEPANLNLAKQDGHWVATVIPARAPDGYSGAIKLIVGVNVDGSIAGVRVLAHNETPGLGDKVDTRKSDWVLSFDGKSIGKPPLESWAVKKDGGEFDQFTGATITPRAVVKKVRDVLEYYQANKATIMAAAKADNDE